MELTIENGTENLIKDIVKFRREIHQNPELSGVEFETSKRIQKKLAEHGIPYKTGFAKTGVLGIIKGKKTGKTVALRADIDALPITEKTSNEFASKVPGIMHACGHDAHTAMLLGTGIILNERKEELEGTILLVFQPAEENAPTGGAKQMMDDGVFDQYIPDVIMAQHVWPDLPVGSFGILPGPMMGNSDRFKITVKGLGGHASMPHQTIDAIVVANQIMSTLQTIVSRNVDPLSSAVVTIGKMEGGYRYNVIADQVTLEGTVRTFLDETKEQIKNRFHSVVTGVAHSMGAEVDIEYWDGYPATVNTPKWTELVKQTAIDLFGAESVPNVTPCLGGEDFGRFLQKYEGVYFWLGSSIGEGQKPLHHPNFEINEEALSYGMKLMSQAAINTLNQLNQEKDGKNEPNSK